MFGGYPHRRVYEAKPRFKMQREKSPERVHFGKVILCPVVTELSVAAAGDAGDVAQSSGIDVSGSRERPWAALRPACHSEFAVPQRVGDRRHVVGPSGVAA